MVETARVACRQRDRALWDMSPRLPPPGRLVDIGGHRLHLHCAGGGAPTVVLDAALGGSSISWAHVQPAVAAFARVCSYDRAGFGWSDAGPMPRTAGRAADELHRLLHTAGERAPYLLVGHSYGGLVARIFAARHPHEIAGLVLVDPAHPEDWLEPHAENQARIAHGTRLCRQGAVAARLGIARVVSALVRTGALTPARALVRLVSRGGLSATDEGILAPIWLLPPDARKPLFQFWTRPEFFEALGSQIASICDSAAETLDAAPDGYGDLPLVTISATEPAPWKQDRQDRLARLSTRGRHIVASNSGHWIPLEQPDVVVEAIRELV
jgi:pimeloyl-ACP methyl ester carboxylesterase